MNTKNIFIISLCFLILVSGCSTPLGRFLKGEKKEEKLVQNQEKNDTSLNEKVKGYVYAADTALSLDTNPTIFSSVAKKFTERAEATMGLPEMEQITQLRQIVSDLVSTNAKITIRGEKALAAKDLEVVDLQQEKRDLQEKVDKVVEKNKEISSQNAVWASKWVRMIRIFYWLIGSIIMIFVLSTISKFLPPPYNTIGAIIWAPVGILLKFAHGCFPEAKKFAGVVAEKTYTETNNALKDVVEAIENWKKVDKKGFETLKPELLDKTGRFTTRPVIEKIVSDYKP